MLFWLFVIMFVVSILIAALCFKHCFDYDIDGIFASLACLFFVLIFVSLIIICFNHIGNDADIETYNVRYEMLKYQYENDMYDNDNDIGKYELIKSIQEWNENLASKKQLQRDFWVGIYIPNIYDDLEFISLEK